MSNTNNLSSSSNKSLITIYVGRALLPLVNPEQEGKLLKAISPIRKQIEQELGFIIPGITFKDNLQLKPNEYHMKIRDVVVAHGEIYIKNILAVITNQKICDLHRMVVVDQMANTIGIWITPEQRTDAEKMGCMILEPLDIIVKQIKTALCNNADLFTKQQET